MKIFRRALARDGTISLKVSVRPSAAVTKFRELRDDGSLKIDIAAAPEGDKANAELVRFVAEELGVSRSSVEIIAGHTARRKVVRVRRGEG